MNDTKNPNTGNTQEERRDFHDALSATGFKGDNVNFASPQDEEKRKQEEKRKDYALSALAQQIRADWPETLNQFKERCDQFDAQITLFEQQITQMRAQHEELKRVYKEREDLKAQEEERLRSLEERLAHESYGSEKYDQLSTEITQKRMLINDLDESQKQLKSGIKDSQLRIDEATAYLTELRDKQIETIRLVKESEGIESLNDEELIALKQQLEDGASEMNALTLQMQSQIDQANTNIQNAKEIQDQINIAQTVAKASETLEISEDGYKEIARIDTNVAQNIAGTNISYLGKSDESNLSDKDEMIATLNDQELISLIRQIQNDPENELLLTHYNEKLCLRNELDNQRGFCGMSIEYAYTQEELETSEQNALYQKSATSYEKTLESSNVITLDGTPPYIVMERDGQYIALLEGEESIIDPTLDINEQHIAQIEEQIAQGKVFADQDESVLMAYHELADAKYNLSSLEDEIEMQLAGFNFDQPFEIYTPLIDEVEQKELIAQSNVLETGASNPFNASSNPAQEFEKLAPQVQNDYGINSGMKA